MNHVPLARDMETVRQDNDDAPLYRRKRTMERTQRLNFLKLSARYLGQTLTARQLHSLAGRTGQ